MKKTILFLFIFSCRFIDTNVLAEDFHPNGTVKMRVYKANQAQQNLVQIFDDQGNLERVYFQKNGITDSLVIDYKAGKIWKKIQLSHNEPSTGRIYIYNEYGQKSEEIGMHHSKFDGWAFNFNPQGDTILFRYLKNDHLLYSKQPSHTAASGWEEFYLPMVAFEKDSAHVGESLKAILSFPIPDSLIDTTGFRIGVYETEDQGVFDLPELGNQFNISDHEFSMAEISSELSTTRKQPTKVSFIFRLIGKHKINERFPFLKKSIVFF